ncbi:GntR family transcriptional regulator [Streptomyces diacarni]|uniref:GntR family transcriptional regulator n=1 Tax=Streptomyces diacarni TaxID=2800381 RepID=A0A367EI42_9ACTN|nr:GntR family transcriptional regulator [Streptomyces diacarni]RCG17756.1 GntR family transcriptional regulator [Streptomyces diacarni]
MTPAPGGPPERTDERQPVGEYGRLPKHETLRRRLRREIGHREPHSLLPTERELAVRYQVSRSTVRQALDALAEAGAVYRVHGAGTFVAAPTISKSHLLTSFTEDMQARGLQAGTRILAFDETEAGRRTAEDLGTEPTEKVTRLVRLRTADARPMCLETAHLRSARVPGLLARDDLDGSLYRILEREYGLHLVRAEQAWTAVTLDERSAALLGVPSGSAAFHVRRVGMDERDRPQEATTSLYRADRYDVRLTVRRTYPRDRSGPPRRPHV